MPKFNVTFEVVTDESAEESDYDESGFISQNVGLRDALDDVSATRTSGCDGVLCIEPSCSDIGQARWITVNNGMEYETGDYESRSLHIPDHVTAASRRRIARLMGASA